MSLSETLSFESSQCTVLQVMSHESQALGDCPGRAGPSRAGAVPSHLSLSAAVELLKLWAPAAALGGMTIIAGPGPGQALRLRRRSRVDVLRITSLSPSRPDSGVSPGRAAARRCAA